MKINIVKYNPNWTNIFHQTKLQLEKVLPDTDIEHIGSTSVVGLISKPIIDILIGIPNQTNLDDYIDIISSLGFTYISKYENDIPNRRFFILDINNKRTHHIHLVKKDTDWFKRHIAFRDELRGNTKVKFDYQLLKLQLATIDWKSGDDYAEAKSSFIRSVENSI